MAYLLLHLPGINRALWHSAARQAHLMSTSVAGHRYAMATVDAIGFALLALSLAGSLYVMVGLTRRLTATGLRWTTGHRARRLLLAAAGLAVMFALAIFWSRQGQFQGW